MATIDYLENQRLRAVPDQFVRSKHSAHCRTLEIDDIQALRAGRVSQAALAAYCLRDPVGFARMLDQHGVNLKSYPSVASLVVAQSKHAKDFEASLLALKAGGGQIGWPEMRLGARHGSTADFLVLMKHGPARDSVAAADQFADILADNNHLIKPAVESPFIGPMRGRVVRAVESLTRINPDTPTPRTTFNPLVRHRPQIHEPNR